MEKRAKENSDKDSDIKAKQQEIEIWKVRNFVVYKYFLALSRHEKSFRFLAGYLFFVMLFNDNYSADKYIRTPRGVKISNFPRGYALLIVKGVGGGKILSLLFPSFLRML